MPKPSSESPGAAGRLAILGYHKIGDPAPGGWETWFYISEELFARQLADLRDGGWTVLDLRGFLKALSDPAAAPRKAALLTFDDGYRSMLGAASRVLARFGYPGVLFVPTAYVGGDNAFDADVEPREPICTWDELRELGRRGIAIQAHGVTHRRASELTPAELDDEIRRSKAALEAELREPVDVFSFPYGDEGKDAPLTARLLAAAGYTAACLYGGGVMTLPAAEPYRLTRIAMGPETDLREALG